LKQAVRLVRGDEMPNQSQTNPSRYDPPSDLVALGAHVEVALIDNHGEVERLSFDIVPDEAADFDAGFLGGTTPLARAIMGRSTGTRVPYRLGDLVQVQILSVVRSQRSPDTTAAATREAAAREAADRAALEETIQLALTFSSKWGDYDPTPLEREEASEEEDE
jgi:hypothetical protein